MIGTVGTRLLREKRVQGRSRRRKERRGRTPAESECLEWKSMFKLYKPSMKFQLLWKSAPFKVPQPVSSFP
ncbi:hypothetical protein C6W19_01300 [Bacillus sp. RJGP41]|nr:hypothetical protein C6W19_01300 [Bacillus sp. RJGP41]